MQEAQKTPGLPRLQNGLETQPDVVQIKASLKTPTPLKTADATPVPAARETPRPVTMHGTPTQLGSVMMPFLAVAAGLSALAAVWSYTTLEETRGQLASMTEAKASVDRSLADARGRLSAAEKAVADVKAALTAAPK
jgi:hypothetical protein